MRALLPALLLLAAFLAASTKAEGNETVFVGDSTNITCCYLWCCGEGYEYCDRAGIPGCQGIRQTTAGGNYHCKVTETPFWMGMCGDGDFVEWVTPDLPKDNYTINITAGCMAFGSCVGDCALELMVDNRVVQDLIFKDTNFGDRNYTASNYTFNTTLQGRHTIKLNYVNDCFSGSGGDRNLYAYGVKITTDKRPDLWINESEIWVFSFNSTINEGDDINFTTTVRNKGNGTASNFTVRFKDDNNPGDISRGFIQERVIDSLPANSSRNVTFNWKVTGGSREISFFADANRSVWESNESNNIAFYNITIKQAPPPDYTPFIYACAGIALLAIIAGGLLIWRSVSYRPPEQASNTCPRCGMPITPTTKTCPVCGKKIS